MNESLDLAHVGLEWVAHHEEIMAFAGDRIPVDDVRAFFLAKGRDRMGAAARARVGRRREGGIALPDEIVPFADALGRLQSEKEAASRVNVMIFEVEALQP